jgi:hypothetical protein
MDMNDRVKSSLTIKSTVMVKTSHATDDDILGGT